MNKVQAQPAARDLALPAGANAHKKGAQVVIVLVPVQHTHLGELAQLHGVRPRVKLVELQARGSDNAQIVALVLHPHCAHDAVTPRCFARDVERLLRVAVVNHGNLVRTYDACMD